MPSRRQPPGSRNRPPRVDFLSSNDGAGRSPHCRRRCSVATTTPRRRWSSLHEGANHMSLYLQSNTSALIAENYFNMSNSAIQSSFTKLSSGYRINSAADDAAGLGIAKSMNAQVQSYTVASQNANDAVSMVQTADGSADQVESLLTRMRELAVEAQNGTMNTNDISNLNTEFQQDLSEIDR